MSIMQTDRPAGWRWTLWTWWSKGLLFAANHLVPAGWVDWVFENTGPFTRWCMHHSPYSTLRQRAGGEVDGDR